MTLREAMKLLDLNERTLDISMLESAARVRMDQMQTPSERDQVLEAYRRVQIFLDPSADERFSMRGPNVLAALSETREYAAVKQEADHDVILVDDESDEPEPMPSSSALVISADGLQPNVMDGLQPNAMDGLQPNAMDGLQLDTSGDLQFGGINELQSNTVHEWQSNAVHEWQADTINKVQLDTVNDLQADAQDSETNFELELEMDFETPDEPEIESIQPLEPESTLLFSAPLEDVSAVPESTPSNLRSTAELPLLNYPIEPTEPSALSEFDDSLLAPKVVPDEKALTIIDEKVQLPKPARVATATPEAKKDKTNPSTVTPLEQSKALGSVGQPERRVSRAAQAGGVQRAYEPKKKSSSQPPLWALLLAVVTVIGTGIFAAPMLIKQFSNNANVRPANPPAPDLSVPTVPQAPTKPAVKPAVKPNPKPSKPSTSSANQIKAKPSQAKPSPSSPQSTAPVSTPIAKPVAAKPVVKPPVAQPTAKPVTKPAPKPQDPQSATSLPPIGSAPVSKPAPKPTAKPVVAKPKPAPKPTTKPAAKPVAVKPKPAPKPVVTKPTPKPAVVAKPEEPTPTPVVQAPAPVAEVIDPNNLTREQIGRRFLNEKYYADWLSRGAQLKYPSWADVPIAVQVSAFADFRSTVLISLP